MSIHRNNQFRDCTAISSSAARTARRPLTPFPLLCLSTLRERKGKRERYMCHANIPLGSHDIVAEGGRTITPISQKRRGERQETHTVNFIALQCGQCFSVSYAWQNALRFHIDYQYLYLYEGLSHMDFLIADIILHSQ